MLNLVANNSQFTFCSNNVLDTFAPATGFAGRAGILVQGTTTLKIFSFSILLLVFYLHKAPLPH